MYGANVAEAGSDLHPAKEKFILTNKRIKKKKLDTKFHEEVCPIADPAKLSESRDLKKMKISLS